MNSIGSDAATVAVDTFLQCRWNLHTTSASLPPTDSRPRAARSLSFCNHRSRSTHWSIFSGFGIFLGYGLTTFVIFFPTLVHLALAYKLWSRAAQHRDQPFFTTSLILLSSLTVGASAILATHQFQSTSVTGGPKTLPHFAANLGLRPLSVSVQRFKNHCNVVLNLLFNFRIWFFTKKHQHVTKLFLKKMLWCSNANCVRYFVDVYRH